MKNAAKNLAGSVSNNDLKEIADTSNNVLDEAQRGVDSIPIPETQETRQEASIKDNIAEADAAMGNTKSKAAGFAGTAKNIATQGIGKAKDFINGLFADSDEEPEQSEPEVDINTAPEAEKDPFSPAPDDSDENLNKKIQQKADSALEKVKDAKKNAFDSVDLTPPNTEANKENANNPKKNKLGFSNEFGKITEGINAAGNAVANGANKVAKAAKNAANAAAVTKAAKDAADAAAAAKAAKDAANKAAIAKAAKDAADALLNPTKVVVTPKDKCKQYAEYEVHLDSFQIKKTELLTEFKNHHQNILKFIEKLDQEEIQNKETKAYKNTIVLQEKKYIDDYIVAAEELEEIYKGMVKHMEELKVDANCKSIIKPIDVDTIKEDNVQHESELTMDTMIQTAMKAYKDINAEPSERAKNLFKKHMNRRGRRNNLK